MENDQRLTPLPVAGDLQSTNIDFSGVYSPTYGDSIDSKRSLRQYFNVVYKRLPIIMAITILVTAAVSFYSYKLPSIYEAKTEMIIEPRKQAQSAKEININFGDDPKYYNTQLQLLQNPDLMKRVVVALGLHRDANALGEPNRGLLAPIRGLFAGSQKPAVLDNTLPIVGDDTKGTDKENEIKLSPEENARAEQYAGTLVSGLTVQQQERTNIVHIIVTQSNPVLAAKVADKVAELFIAENEKTETAGAKQQLTDLNSSIDGLRATIAEEERNLMVEMGRADLPLQEKGGELRQGNLSALMTLWRDAQNETGRLKAQYDAAVNASKTGDILAVLPDNKAIIDARNNLLKQKTDLRKNVDDIDKKINDSNEKLKGLLEKYTPEYRDVKELQARIAELTTQKSRVEQEVSKKIEEEGTKLENDAKREALVSLRSQLSAAQQREARQGNAFEDAARKANVEGQAETRLIGLNREIASNRGLLDTYLQRQKEQELALSSERPNNIKLQNNAVTPTSPIGPNRGRNILVALLLSLGAGIGLAFLLDYLDDSVRTSDDIGRHLGLPTLALIPHYLNNEKRKLLPGKPAPPSAALITMDERNSPMAEAYRHLRTSLLFSSAGKPPQTILVTSSQPSEGKTTTAINTAITLAQSDVDVIIVDCDLRRPRLHSHFGLENTRGLTNYLSGDKDTGNLIRTYSDLPRLKIITSGPIPPNPAELLSSNEMRNLLQFLTGKFKHVIIDSPPAISFTDASILSTLVDGVVLVAMANKSSIHLMRQFKQRVSSIGARIYGVVLNGIKAGSAEYYYYGSGYYNYYSKSSEDESTPLMSDMPRSDSHTLDL
ncbi:exopolysaccharide regulatory tyrosine autokinase VpsO [soil metagenome]